MTLPDNHPTGDARLYVEVCPECGVQGSPELGFRMGPDCVHLDKELERIEVVEASELAEAEEALRECTRLSGADLSGEGGGERFPDWPKLPQLAVESVREMRETYDEDAAVMELQAENTLLRERGDALVKAVHHYQWGDHSVEDLHAPADVLDSALTAWRAATREEPDGGSR